MERDERIERLHDILAHSSRAVFFGGAGLSTESGIPDFRSENGIYRAKSAYGFPPETLLSHSFFVSRPETFFDYYRKNLIYPDAKPNPAHYALAELAEELIAGFHVEAFFVFVEAVIVRIHIRIDVLRKLLLIGEEVLEIRAEHLKIRCFLCAVPYIVGFYHELLISNVFIHRDLLHLADVLEKQVDHALLVAAEVVLVSIQELQKLYCFV